MAVEVSTEELFITREKLYEMMFQALVKAATYLPQDVRKALKASLDKEEEPLARLHLSTILDNADLVEAKDLLACSDTGWPLFYVRIGDNVRVEGGFSTLYDLAREVVDHASRITKLRATLVHPLTRMNPGNNIGNYFPKVELRFDPQIDFLEVIAVPKGGGSEIFGTSYRMLVAADGKTGIYKLILDTVLHSMHAGKTCPPNIVGIGIGGSADVCMKIAKEACILRPMGDRHPEPEIARMELELIDAFNSFGIGPMGSPGKTAVMDVHIEYAMTHTAALPVAISTQCSLGRRATARFGADGVIKYGDHPEWSYRG